MHFQADGVIFNRGLVIGFFFGFNILAFKQHDVFRIIKFHDIGAGIRSARHYRAHDQRIGIPLHHDIGIVSQPDRAILGDCAIGIAQDLLLPRLIYIAARFAQAIVDADGLHAIPVTKVPCQVITVNKMAQAGMERGDVVILKVHLDKGFPVEVIFCCLYPVQHIAAEVHILHHADIGQVFKNIAPAGKQQAVPTLQRCFSEV